MEGQGLIILLYSPAQEESIEEYMPKSFLSKSPDGPSLRHCTPHTMLNETFSESLIP